MNNKILTYKLKFEEDKQNSKEMLDLIYDLEFSD